jgi:hypothetical protein
MTDVIKTSASAIEAFDDSTPFGCNRRWYFEKVMKLPTPPRDNLTLGSNLHKAIESFLEKGAPGDIAPEVQRLFHAIKPEVLRVRDEGFLALEHPIDFMLEPDIRIIGYIDVLRKNGPLDWKTSSDVGKYAPTPYKLARSTQMLIYSRWQRGAFTPASPLPMESPSQVTHVYVQTKGTPVTQRVDAQMSPALLTEGISRVINVARQMKSALSLPSVGDLKPDRSKCRSGTKMSCPFLAVCPVENSTMSSALDRLKARLNTATPLPAAVKEVVKAASVPAAQAIVPPDAPAPAKVEKFMAVPPPRSESVAQKERKLVIQEPLPEPTPEMVAQVDAALAKATEAKAKPPFGSAAVATSTATAVPAATEPAPGTMLDLNGDPLKLGEPEKKRGRPPGAKNKPKTAAETLPPGSTGTGGIEQAVQNIVKNELTFKTITVTMTGKLNMGHFQSMDICVSQTADYRGDPEEAFIRVTDVVKKQLDAALENIAGRTVQAPVPAEVLMSTKR